MISLDKWKDLISISVNIASIAAIIVGGFWTYLLFVKRRSRHPHVNLSQDVTFKPLQNGKVLLNVEVKISNVGAVLVSLRGGEITVSQVSPLNQPLEELLKKNQEEILWPVIDSRELKWQREDFEIEPGETDSVTRDFIIEKTVKIVQIYSYFKNVSKKRGPEIGWSITKIYDVA